MRIPCSRHGSLAWTNVQQRATQRTVCPIASTSQLQTLASRSKSERCRRLREALNEACGMGSPTARRQSGHLARFNASGRRRTKGRGESTSTIMALPSCGASTLIFARACASRSTCVKHGRSGRGCGVGARQYWGDWPGHATALRRVLGLPARPAAASARGLPPRRAS